MTRSLINRRSVLGAGIAALGWHAAPIVAGIPAGAAVPLGLQLFSLDVEMRQDLPGTLRQVRAMGYREVELVGYYGRSAADLRSALRAASLECRAIHIRPVGESGDIPGLAADPQWHISRCRKLGVSYLVCPGPWFPERVASTLPSSQITVQDIVAAAGLMTHADWQNSAELINTCAEGARKNGLRLLYHNGNLEFASCAAGTGTRTGFDILLQHFDPAWVELELDCGWILSAGHDPIQYLQKLTGRVPLVHIKDLKATPPNTRMTLNPAPIGEGIVDWRRLLEAVRSAHVKCAFLEQEAPFARPALDYARDNLRFLTHFQAM